MKHLAQLQWTRVAKSMRRVLRASVPCRCRARASISAWSRCTRPSALRSDAETTEESSKLPSSRGPKQKTATGLRQWTGTIGTCKGGLTKRRSPDRTRIPPKFRRDRRVSMKRWRFMNRNRRSYQALLQVIIWEQAAGESSTRRNKNGNILLQAE